MILRTLWTALAVLAPCGVTTDARADVIVTRDGQILPDKLKDAFDPETAPSNAVLEESGRDNLELSCDNVKIAGKTISAAEVRDAYSTTAYLDPNFNDAEVQGGTGAWDVVANQFAAAAESLKGTAKQIAMYRQVLALQLLGDSDRILAAADAFLAAFPTGYYVKPVQEARARALIHRGDAAGARAALDAVINLRQMNPRDRYAAAILKVDFFTFKPATKPEQFAAAEKLYRDLLRQIDGDPQARLAIVERLLCQTRIAQCHLMQNDPAKDAEAARLLEAVIADPASLYSKGLRADAYLSLGNAVYAGVRRELESQPAEPRLPKILETLDTAALHYLRVTLLYRDAVDSGALFDATVNLARVWATQFHVGKMKDCPTGKRAVQHFVQAHNMLQSGERRRLLGQEAKKFMDTVQEACAVPEEAASDGDGAAK